MSKHIVWRNKLINVCQNTLYEGNKLINVYQNTLYEGTNLLMYIKTHCMKEQTY